ncbi:hypothetical protein TVAG_277360 [Trichomonas vaginalis G3]|uniref:Importin N-terminal domain-containing protein n=1 Tax=Trichomonas vaginalis (strain ATCC PRA-98 / G3) TaxID=412133 RepID=A2FTU5_TRIV3|nr:armadillo (ARM) repeat-containing protein family [Trichomonas vaginalis G3]EAX91666.1 hypothetical protein TVAG_277360 [Trichomonas vaginalis G3]KAI5487244.1 armadillo (ARM) repeat-containing protein family [Trichomonas vaginalis G3]|eukprot:XP_001304596.1 hypothetical protein [Trichomonas vaginalis G3]
MENIPKIIEFGNAVLAGAKPGTVTVPEYTISPQNFKELAEHVSNSNDQALKVGFSNSIYRLLLLNYNNSDEDNAKVFRNSVLEFAIKNTVKNTLSGILKSTNELLSQTEGKWPELIEFLLKNETENNYFRGQFIAVATYIRETDFPVTNRDALLPVIDNLLKSSEDLPISSLLLVITLTKADINQLQPYINTIWESALKCAESSDFHAVCSAMHDLHQIPGFDKLIPDCVSKKIEIFSNQDLDLENRIKEIHPCIKLFPFLDEKSMENILQVISSEVTTNVENSIKILDTFEETEVDLLNEGSIVILSTYIRILVEGDNPAQGLVFLEPFADQVLDDEDFENEVNELILKTLQDENKAICALYSLKTMSTRMQKPNLDLFKLVLDYIPRDDTVGYHARIAMESLIETQLFVDDVYVKSFVESFQKFQGKTSLFVKFVIKLLNSLPEIGLVVCQGLFEFSVPLISEGKSDEEKSVALSFFAQLAEVDKDYVVDRLDDMMATSLSLMESKNPGCVAASADFLASVANSFEQETREKVFDQIPKMLQIVRREIEGFPEIHRNAVATSLSDIVSQFDLRETAEELANIAMKDLNSNDEETKGEAIHIIYIICQNLLPDVAQTVFNDLASKLEQMEDQDNAETSIRALKDLLKKYKIDREIVMNLVKSVYEGRIKAIGQIDSIENDETEVFELLKNYVIKYKNDALIFVRQVIGVLPFIDSSVLSLALAPINEALNLCKERDYLTDNDIQTIVQTLMTILNQDDPESVNSISDTLINLIMNFTKFVDTQQLVNKINDLWETCDEKEDKEQTCSLAMICFALLTQNVFIEQLFADLIQLMPISCETFSLKQSVEMMKKAAETLQSRDILSFVYEYLCRFELMKKSQIEEYDEEIPQNLQSSIRQFIKEKLKNDNQMKDEMTKTLLAKNYGKVLVASLFK